jgi:hypothetical protein
MADEDKVMAEMKQMCGLAGVSSQEVHSDWMQGAARFLIEEVNNTVDGRY